MDRGIYNATAAGLVADRQIQVVANNIANVNTAGFKGQRLLIREQAFEDTLASSINSLPERARSDQQQTPGAVDVTTVTDHSIGPVSFTGDPLNVALRDEGTFFVIQAPQGEVYTRAGDFSLNAQRQLVTTDGLQVMAEGGAIEVPPGDVEITNSGTVTVDGEVIAKLRIVKVDKKEDLERVEGVRFKLKNGGAVPAENAEVVPRSLEMPNVNVVTSMVDLITASKAFEAYSKVLRNIDELNERAIRSARSMG